jgi:hypothetical protein
MFLGGKGRPARGADNLTAICEPIVLKMWEPLLLTPLWAFTACYRDSFIFIGVKSIYIFLLLLSVEVPLLPILVDVCLCVFFPYVSCYILKYDLLQLYFLLLIYYWQYYTNMAAMEIVRIVSFGIPVHCLDFASFLL